MESLPLASRQRAPNRAAIVPGYELDWTRPARRSLIVPATVPQASGRAML